MTTGTDILCSLVGHAQTAVHPAGCDEIGID